MRIAVEISLQEIPNVSIVLVGHFVGAIATVVDKITIGQHFLQLCGAFHELRFGNHLIYLHGMRTVRLIPECDQFAAKLDEWEANESGHAVVGCKNVQYQMSIECRRVARDA